MGLARRDRWSWAREMERPRQGRLLAGVCAGLARGLAMDATLLRLAFILLALASGIGLLLYLALWMLVPDEDLDLARGSYRDVVRGNLRGMTHDMRHSVQSVGRAWADAGQDARWPRPLNRRWIAVGLMGAGLLVFLHSLGVFAWLGFGRTLGLSIVAIGAALLFSSTGNGR